MVTRIEPLTPEQRAARRQAYEERKMKAAEAQVITNQNGTVNIEYFIYQLVKDSGATEEQIKQACEQWNADYERVKLYLLFSYFDA